MRGICREYIGTIRPAGKRGRDNRTTGLRVPVSTPEARRIENRLAGMDCNPYLCIAASLACGYLGMVQQTPAGQMFEGDAYQSDAEIPYSLSDALDLPRTVS